MIGRSLLTPILASTQPMVNAMPHRPALSAATGRVVGVDFSGAAKSGKTAWLAELDVFDAARMLKLRSIAPLGRLAGSDDRADVCGYLAERILSAESTLFGMDFPFGLPIELGLGDWPDQLSHVASFDGDAKDFGRSLVEVAKGLGDTMHIRRVTDRETQTPFDCYHYRIIYQTFHGMRDVLRPIAGDAATAVLPFQYQRVDGAKRFVVEGCPSSTLKRLGLPHQRYKQSGGKPPDAVHQKTRQTILSGIQPAIEISLYQRRVIMRDSGGDALDAVLAGFGSWQAFQTDDHESIANHDRYPIEGRVYA